MNLFDLGLEERESALLADSKELVKQFTARPCIDCPLRKLSPNNPGFVYRGSFAARIGVLVDMPSPEDMTCRRALADLGRSSWREWVQYLGLHENDFFVTHVVQCKTQRQVTSGKNTKGFVDKPVAVRMPEMTDANICFYRKALPVLKALPNMEVLLALGVLPIKMLLGEHYKAKQHEGNFYLSDVLPQVPIFCLEHPRDYVAGGSVKRIRLHAALDIFMERYLKTKDILKIHQWHADARNRDEDAELNYSL